MSLFSNQGGIPFFETPGDRGVIPSALGRGILKCSRFQDFPPQCFQEIHPRSNLVPLEIDNYDYKLS